MKYYVVIMMLLLSPVSHGIPLFFGELKGKFDGDERVEVSRDKSKKIPLFDKDRKNLLASLAPAVAALKLQEYVEESLGSHRVPVIAFHRQLEIDFQMGSHSADYWVKGRYGERVLQRVWGMGENHADTERIIGRYPFSYHVELVSSERTEATPYALEMFDLFIRNQKGEIIYGATQPFTSRDLEAWRIPAGGKDELEIVLTNSRAKELRAALIEARANLGELTAQFILSGPYIEERTAKTPDPQLSLPMPEFTQEPRGPSQLIIALDNEQLRHLLRMPGYYTAFKYRRDLAWSWCQRILGNK